MKPGLFKNCKVAYSKDAKQQIYSVKVTLNNKPRILTVRVGNDFTELSLAEPNGKIIEVARQEGNKPISFFKAN